MSENIKLNFTKNTPSLSLTPTPPAQLPISLAEAIKGVSKSDTFTWNQTIALSVWTIPHNLNKFPSVNVVDTLGNLIYPDVSYVNSNIVQVTHGSAFAGKAYLN